MSSISERVAPGQVWKDKRVGRPPYDDFRRLATVVRTDHRYVYVVGRYEQCEDDGWRPAGWPNGERHSRVLIEGFVRTHELFEPESVITERREAAE